MGDTMTTATGSGPMFRRRNTPNSRLERFPQSWHFGLVFRRTRGPAPTDVVHHGVTDDRTLRVTEELDRIDERTRAATRWHDLVVETIRDIRDGVPTTTARVVRFHDPASPKLSTKSDDPPT